MEDLAGDGIVGVEDGEQEDVIRLFRFVRFFVQLLLDVLR